MKQDRVVPVVRRPAVAGYFYPADPALLRGQLDAFMRADVAAAPVPAVIVPHGSYTHSGALAGAALSRVTIPRRCILVGPSHTGSWMPWSLLMEGAYRTPLGDVPIDTGCAEALRARCPFLEPDAWAQRGEHAIEVVLPFLQWRGPAELAVVPIVTGSDDPDEFARLGAALAQVVRLQEEPVLLIASSDLSHYESRARAFEQDRALLGQVQALDGAGLIRHVQEHPVSMCGYGPVAAVLEAAKTLGAHRAALVGYRTSAEAGGDPDSVIGYASVIIE